MAGAIAFNVLVALVPLLLMGIGITGYVLSARFGDPTEALMGLLAENVPQAGSLDVVEAVRGPVARLVAQRSGFTLVGAVVLVWIATRLVGSLRVALREVFDVGQDRGLLRGKLFDVQVVVVGGGLLTLNLGVTVALKAAMNFGVGILGLGPETVSLAQRLTGQLLALTSAWVLFLIVYRYLPVRRLAWRTSLVAATFAAVCHELLKQGFSWYATEVADYGSTFGNVATLALLIFWIYYGSLVFILGGEVAQVYTMRKATRVRMDRSLEVAG